MNFDNFYFTFDDFLLMPDYSDVERNGVSLKKEFFGRTLELPILSSPMDTVSGYEMVRAMRKWGAMGIHHRYCPDQELMDVAIYLDGGVAISPSSGFDFVHSLLEIKPDLIFVMDVAHGNTTRNLEFCRELVDIGANVVSGNIANEDAALRYLDIGVTHFRVGVGSGSVCTTRINTGVGVPQASAISKISKLKERYPNIKIISDGGHKNAGDIVKAFACGADLVMLGGMLAGTDESLGKQVYRGMASADALSTRKKEFFVEGITRKVKPKGSVVKVLKQIEDSLKQACYYTGCQSLFELQFVTKIFLTQGSMVESYRR